MDVLFDIDTQNSFCNQNGELFVPGADTLKVNQAELVAKARTRKILHLATADDHEWWDPEISFSPDFKMTYPPHCMRGTYGAEKTRDTKQLNPIPFGLYPYSQQKVAELLSNSNEVLILKKHFDVFSNPNTEYVINHLDPNRIIVFGVALDVCIRAVVEGLLQRGHNIYLVHDACAGLDVIRSEALITEWATKGVTIINTDEALLLMGMAEKVS